MGCCSSNISENNNSKNGIAPIEYDIKSKNKFVVFNQSPITDCYRFIDKIGSGSYGQVLKAVNIKTNIYHAIKIVTKKFIKQQDDEQIFLKEIEIMSYLDHPNICKIYEYFENETDYFIVQEFINGYELVDFFLLTKSENLLTEKVISNLIKQILSALKYLHKYEIIHRDIKHQNIMVLNNNYNPDNGVLNTDTGKINITIKLIDFGISNICSKNQKLTKKIGSVYYLAPEVINQKYNEKCDIWSTGVVMHVLFTGKPPFTGINNKEIFESIKNDNYTFPEKISKQAQNFLSKIFEKDFEERPSAEKLLDHEFIIDNEELKFFEKGYYLDTYEALRKFSIKPLFSKICQSYITFKMIKQEQVKKLTEIFLELDTSNDNKLSYKEIKEGYSKLNQKLDQFNVSEIELFSLFKKMDINETGLIEYHEFINSCISSDEIFKLKNMEVAFHFFDLDRSGKLCVNEIKAAFSLIDIEGIAGEENDKIAIRVKEVLGLLDKNNDELIDFEEFLKLLEIK